MVLRGAGEHFCAGLDLSELAEHSVAGGIVHSRMLACGVRRVQFGRVPVISVLHGAVIGGGLELASATHIRVAEDSAFYALPEGPARALRRRRRIGTNPAADRRLAA